jgi:hypothetical protein
MTRATLFLSLVGLTVYKRAPWYLKKIKRNRPNRRNPTGRKAYNQRLHISSCLFYIFCFPFFFAETFRFVCHTVALAQLFFIPYYVLTCTFVL